MLFTQNVRDKETGEEELNSILNYILVLPTAVESGPKKNSLTFVSTLTPQKFMFFAEKNAPERCNVAHLIPICMQIMEIQEVLA